MPTTFGSKAPMPQSAKPPVHWIVRMNRRNRTMAFVWVLLVLAAHMWGRGFGPVAWALLGLQFLVYPQVAYLAAVRSSKQMRTEFGNMLLDGLMFGIWMAALRFPLWPSYTLFICAAINMTVFRGAAGALLAAAVIACGTLLGAVVFGLHTEPATGPLTTSLSIATLSLYLLVVAKDAYARSLMLFQTRQQLRAKMEEVLALQQRLQEQSTQDPLTGLFNRRYLVEAMERELSRCARAGLPLSILLMDIDHFKRINDAFGHQAGDAVIVHLAHLLRQHARAGDVVCRYGGEEFLLLCPEMPQAAALERAQQYRTSLAAQPLQVGTTSIPMTLSAGVATFPEHGDSAEALIRSADEALYRAKGLGRNRVELAGLSG